MSQKRKSTHPLVFFIFFSFVLSTPTTKTKPNKYGWDKKKMYIDFDESMKLSQYPKAIRVTKRITELDGIALLAFFRDLYNKNNLAKVIPSEKPKVPKIIHQIWLGSEMPQELKKYTATWLQKHAKGGWRYKLWTDKDVENFNLYNKDIFDRETNFGAKSDIFRYEILYRHGGVYVDTDFECLRALDLFNHRYDFYVGIQPLDTQYLQLGIGLIGSAPGHPILKHSIETLRHSFDTHKGAPAKTGPIHLTRSFFAVAGKTDTIDIAFPATYFYPLGGYDNDIDRDKWEKIGGFAVHWWGKTWMPLKYRKGDFRKIKNDTLTKNWNK